MLLWIAAVAALLYMAVLFAIAFRRDRRPPETASRAAWLYGLSLGVYCTSWTFFGAVGTAATDGLEFLPIYLGPILLLTVGRRFVQRVIRLGKAHNSNSIADFLSARYGTSAGVAALVTLVAATGALPYMALQLKSVSTSLLALDPSSAGRLSGSTLLLVTATAMAAFAMLFGAQRADRAGRNAGLVLTLSIESVVKLLALLAAGGFAAAILFGASHATVGSPTGLFGWNDLDLRFWVLTAISAAATLCLPRQFHVTVVEAPTGKTEGSGLWLFPAYLALTAAAVVPVAMAGTALGQSGDPDLLILNLPLAAGYDALALLVFLGGFSASTGMIIVANVALSTMITNDLIAPLAFRNALTGRADRSRLRGRLLTTRCVVIAALMASACALAQSALGGRSLAGLGTLAFAAAAQFAPSLIVGLGWRGAHRTGAALGLAGGFAAWLLLLAAPPILGAKPALVIGGDPFVSGTLISLALNTVLLIVGSLLARSTLMDEKQAVAFTGGARAVGGHALSTAKRVGDLRLLLEQFVSPSAATDCLLPRSEAQPRAATIASPEMLARAEREIAGMVGASSARLLLQSWTRGDPVPLANVVAMFDETSRRLHFSADLLRQAIENIDQGLAVVDATMALVAWNRRYEELFALPSELVIVGRPIANLIAFNLARGGVPPAEIAVQVERRLEHMRVGRRHHLERAQHDGRIMRIIGNPAADGGYVTAYTDVTEERRAGQKLERTVAERTAQLTKANAALERATRSKTRFLAAASHDLMQPLNAARLFASALREEVGEGRSAGALLRDLDGAIASADQLIRTLLDISRLDGGAVRVDTRPFALSDLIDEIAREFSMAAAAKGLELRTAVTGAWVDTDRGLLASILRNLVANAIRYTDHGRVLIGVRNRGEIIELTVLDTGFGIAAEHRECIFKEFERAGARGEGGLGLGLAIVARTAALLGTRVDLESQPGHGSAFSLRLLRATSREAVEKPSPPTSTSHHAGVAGKRVLIVENNVAAREGLAALLGRWGLHVDTASGLDDARAVSCPDLLIVDYRLDEDRTGDQVCAQLADGWAATPPSILVTAENGEETQEAARRMGAVRLLKPLAAASLRALIVDRLSRRAP